MAQTQLNLLIEKVEQGYKENDDLELKLKRNKRDLDDTTSELLKYKTIEKEFDDRKKELATAAGGKQIEKLKKRITALEAQGKRDDISKSY